MALTTHNGQEGLGEIQKVVLLSPVVEIVSDDFLAQLPVNVLKEILHNHINSIPHSIKAAVGDFV